MKKILIIVCVLLFAVYAWGASTTAPFGQAIQNKYKKGGVTILHIEWAGESSPQQATRPDDVEFQTMDVNGRIIGCKTNPSATSSGNFDTTAGEVYVVPTDNYDIGIMDNSGIFIFGDTNATSGETLSSDGALANRDTANTEFVWMVKDFSSGETEPPVLLPNHGPLKIFVQNAGATNEGVIEIYYLEE